MRYFLILMLAASCCFAQSPVDVNIGKDGELNLVIHNGSKGDFPIDERLLHASTSIHMISVGAQFTEVPRPPPAPIDPNDNKYVRLIPAGGAEEFKCGKLENSLWLDQLKDGDYIVVFVYDYKGIDIKWSRAMRIQGGRFTVTDGLATKMSSGP